VAAEGKACHNHCGGSTACQPHRTGVGVRYATKKRAAATPRKHRVLIWRRPRKSLAFKRPPGLPCPQTTSGGRTREVAGVSADSGVRVNGPKQRPLHGGWRGQGRGLLNKNTPPAESGGQERAGDKMKPRAPHPLRRWFWATSHASEAKLNQ